MQKLGVFFGGKSCEHEVSVITAITAMNELEDNYEIVPVYMCDKGWFTGELLKNVESYKDFNERLHTKVFLDGNRLYSKTFLGLVKQVASIDVALLCTHGGLGEGGGLAGLLDIYGVPYTSCNLLSSSVCLDKEYFKIIAKEKGFKVVPWVCLDNKQFEIERKKGFARIFRKLGESLVVKPVDSGSSIGVKAVNSIEELEDAIKVALCYSNRAIIEKRITPIVEYNCASCRIGSEIIVSAIENPITKGDILSYDDKYLKGEKNSSINRAVELPYLLANKIRKTTAKLYEEFMLWGVVRVDFIYSEASGELYVNEINTIPGSLSSPLFEECGIEFEVLVDALVDGAKEKQKVEDSYLKHFSSELLSGNYTISKR